jgi:hypothetical protein
MIPTIPLYLVACPINSVINFDKLKEIVFNVFVQKLNLSCRSQGNKENEKRLENKRS